MNDLNIKEAYGFYILVLDLFLALFSYLLSFKSNLIYYILCVFVISNKLFLKKGRF